MSAPALIKQADAQRLLAAARVAGWSSCELIVDGAGAVRLIAREGATPPSEPQGKAWTDDDR
ncbi:hypothetical protein CHH26_11580 [Qipengyuania flava]|uniref:hypothetical protein n=1 Tax=Qipengyuania flava TaxID=192812 RepID=UPI000B8C5F95|nr:hypothetical protein [Qipengyuania flava]ASP30797.1 hypothetical protein CHH26_11580 [Qipengyuania flava]